jgi:staphylococcal nuclease domain-containing protein 1
VGVWQSYKPPELTTASSLNGQIIEVLTGDTVSILPNGVDYDDESKLVKISLASVRAPRIGNEKLGKADEPYAVECKDRLRLLTVGKSAKVEVHYERDIPLPTGIAEKRAFATISVGKKQDIGEVLLSEGLATTQRHRDDEEKSPNYDALCLAEAAAKEAKKNIHNSSTEYKKPMTNDLTDPKKAKAYSGSLIRAGNLKATVEYVFNGSRFKLFIPSENCHVAFACEYLRCPQPTPLVGALGQQQQQKAAEPFGDAAKRFARLMVHQRTVEINAHSVTLGGVITGQLFFGQGAQRKDYTIEILGAGLATLDEKKLEYGEVPKVLMDAQSAAQKNKVGIWSIEPKEDNTKKVIKSKYTERSINVCLSEIRNGSHIFFTIIGDDAASVIADSMKVFTSTHGTRGGPCEVKIGKVVAALFDDGNGSSWYRAKILGRKDKSRVSVLFIDHGNVATVPVSTHLRPLDVELSPTRIPAVAKEAVLALIHVRDLDDDDGLNAARMLQSRAWGKNLTAVIHCELDGRAILSLYGSDEVYGQNDAAKSINEELVAAGYARAAKRSEVNLLTTAVADGNNVKLLAERLAAAQENARKARAGMWRYGDIGDEDDDE